MDNYTFWTKHATFHTLAHMYEAGAFDDKPMDVAGENIVEEQPYDELGQVLLDAQKDSETVKEPKKFEKMLEDHKKLFYSDCKQGNTKLGIILELL
jgi:hypothetical protein